MKRFYFLAFMLMLCLAMCSCTESGTSILGYQNDAEKVTASFEGTEGTFKIEISYSEAAAYLTIKEPENIAGITFKSENGIISATTESIQIPLSPSLCSGLTPIFEAFSLSEENIASISKDENGNTAYTVSSEHGVYTVLQGEREEPHTITYEGERTFSLTDIKLQKNDLTSK